MIRKLLFNLILMLFSIMGSSYAQDRVITGRITSSDDGGPLPGASISVKGTTRGTTTDADGKFSLAVPGKPTLVISSIGFSRQEVEVGNRSTITVQLQSTNSDLEEVIVTGYGGVLSKREVTGAVSKIKGTDIQNVPAQSIDRAMQGRISGVQISSANGAPGGAMQVRIRGVGSITAGNEPLYIVDGVQLNTQNTNSYASSNPINFLNPNDVESIEVLKDAAAASIYGSQAANGVVIITTKKGKAGRTQVKFNYYQGVVEPIKYFDVLNSQQWVNMRTEAFMNANPTQSRTWALQQVLGILRYPAATIASLGENQLQGIVDTLKTYDWQRAAMRTGRVQNYEVSLSGGGERNNFHFSSSYNTQDANVVGVYFKRFTSSLRLGQKLSDKLQFEQSINLSTTTQGGQYASPNGGSFLGSAAFGGPVMVPTNAIYNADGTYANTPQSGGAVGVVSHNFILSADYAKITSITNQLVGSAALVYRITPQLTFRPTVNLDYRIIKGNYYADPRIQDAYSVQGRDSFQNEESINFLTNGALTYSHQFGEHSINALAGLEYRSDTRNGTSGTATGFPTSDFQYISAAANYTAMSSFWTGYHRASAFGKIDYNYNSRYFLSLIGRYDGSSRFGANNLFGFFPSISGSWLVSDEAFLKGNPVLTELKLRASFGSTGNDQIGNFDSRGLYVGGANYNAGSGIAVTSLANPDLKWERNTEIAAGLEYGIFNNRIRGQFDVYDRTSNDLLLQRQVPNTSGFTTITFNAGQVKNRGFEAEITVDVLKTSSLRWESSFNFSVIDNKVTKLYDGISPQANVDSLVLLTAPVQAGNTTVTRNFIVGKPVYANYAPVYAGVNPATGRAMWYDQNGNIVYTYQTPRDSKYLGSDFANIYGGWRNQISYKGFDLTAFFQYEFGRRVNNSQGVFLIDDGTRNVNTLTSVYNNRWTTPGQITDIPRPYNGGAEIQGSSYISATSRTIEDASYIRLKQVQLAYTFPKALLTRTKILQNVRVYAVATNLLTWTKWTGYDPEFLNFGSGNTGAIPQSKTYTFGVEIGL
ncbi:SusC/RagA family TonB-linked outer membrane protein [Spirosoma sp. HMF3257]|uniref:SusC/RagA family TonB-linked outer membrane protein n=2 Tax=Spirosoma telluris TaxID=2183553 RepID=A0A327NII1_9BACT|nr:SusC/RagA family TonB-linked outer membrane protein [Spirosoma telluris]RAI74653.1 SusC/RagA family TonB-linked outer membrane protein [Spirosoma telluris]